MAVILILLTALGAKPDVYVPKRWVSFVKQGVGHDWHNLNRNSKYGVCLMSASVLGKDRDAAYTCYEFVEAFYGEHARRHHKFSVVAATCFSQIDSGAIKLSKWPGDTSKLSDKELFEEYVQPMRIWRNRLGKAMVTGRFDKYEEKRRTVFIRTESDFVQKVRLSILSDYDRNFVRLQIAEAKK